MTSATPSNAFELLLSALQSEAGFTPEQCAIVRAGLDQWGAMVQVLDGGESVQLPAYAGPCRVHRFPLVADDDDSVPFSR
jgi:hypothetical protein